MPAGDVNALADVVEHPQLTGRGRWMEVGEGGRTVQVLRHPFDIAGLPDHPERIPTLGEDTDRLLAARE